MATWTEARGYTLELDPRRRAGRGASRFVRLALVRRAGLLARFNVTESRAEPGDAERGAEALGPGRLLSWRWLSKGDAAGILEDRRRTLEALGYRLAAETSSPQGEWDWLRDLVSRQLDQAREAVEQVARDIAPDAEDAVREVMSRLSQEPGEPPLQRAARRLGMELELVIDPDAAAIARTDRSLLGEVLPDLLADADPQVQTAGARWLAIPATAYELDPAQIEAWLAEDGPAAQQLADRLAREGLALIGPEALGRLARDAVLPEVKDAAQVWVQRLAAP